jgi:hypothetical protein
MFAANEAIPNVCFPPKAAIRAGGHSRSAEHPLSAHDHTTTGDGPLAI